MKVFIINKETGEAKEIKGVVTEGIAIEKPADAEWKQMQGFSVKAKASFKSRRDEKEFRKWARSLPRPRLATKAEIADEIIRLVQCSPIVFAPDRGYLMRKSRKELAKLYLQLKERIYDPPLQS